MIGWRKLALRSQDTLDHWIFDEEDRELQGLVQNDPNADSTVFIPLDKSILFRTETYKDNPEGRSIYRNSVIDYFYLKRNLYNFFNFLYNFNSLDRFSL